MWIRAEFRLLFLMSLTFFVFFGIKGHETDKELKPYVKAFIPKPDKYVYRLVDLNTINKPRKFAHEVSGYRIANGKVVGLAFWGLDTVWIDKFWWKTAHPFNRVSVLWHEYGHHELGPFVEWGLDFSHKNNILFDGCPESIMYHRTISPNCLNKHWKMYVKEVKGW